MNLENKVKNGLKHVRIVSKTAIFAVWNWVREHKKVVRYVIVGGMTTLIDYVISFLLYGAVNEHAANAAAWIGAVTFAFFTNKIWVFESKTKKTGHVLTEFAAFAGGRLLTLGLQEAIFFVACDWLAVPPQYVKIPASIVVMILNYFLSKWIFRKKRDAGAPETQTKPSSPEDVSDNIDVDKEKRT